MKTRRSISVISMALVDWVRTTTATTKREITKQVTRLQMTSFYLPAFFLLTTHRSTKLDKNKALLY